jgi:hypothetical protein
MPDRRNRGSVIMAQSPKQTPKQADAPASPARRDFFKAAAGGAAGAALVVPAVLGGGARAAESGEEQRKTRYQETDHVKTYYQTNRY